MRFICAVLLLACFNVGCEQSTHHQLSQWEEAHNLGREAYNIGIEAGDNPYARSDYAFLAPHWQAGWIEAKMNRGKND